MRAAVLLILFLISFEPVMAQNKKGNLYLLWGWNRSAYTNSTIHFTGDNYDFKLSNVAAKDRPSTIGINPYLHFDKITIPQTNFRIGYFINDRTDISFGYEHMKYVMIQDQESTINGYIHKKNKFDGTYINDAIIIGEELLKFEHTDGLNYFNIEITQNYNFTEITNVQLPKFLDLQLFYGFGVGGILPKSNVLLLYGDRNDEFHWAGYGFSSKIGLDLAIFKYFFLREEAKAGFIDLRDILTTPSGPDRAKQHFFFGQFMTAFGFNIPLK